jgi:hypothetical protein
VSIFALIKQADQVHYGVGKSTINQGKRNSRSKAKFGGKNGAGGSINSDEDAKSSDDSSNNAASMSVSSAHDSSISNNEDERSKLGFVTRVGSLFTSWFNDDGAKVASVQLYLQPLLVYLYKYVSVRLFHFRRMKMMKMAMVQMTI